MEKGKWENRLVAALVLGVILVGMFLFLIIILTLPTGYKDPVGIGEDRSTCAASGIQLNNYVERKENAEAFAQKNTIKYMGNEMQCQTVNIENAETGCKIPTSKAGDDWIKILTNTETCSVENIKDEYHEEYINPKQPINWAYIIFIGMILLIIVDTLFIVAVGIKLALKKKKTDATNK
ncbi:hypothetical protein K8R43_02515 [archaeon]|nr:hypothetical protein [archaeon]